MRNTRLATPMVFAALMLAGCQSEGPLASMNEPLAVNTHDASEARPLRGTCAATGAEFVSMIPPILTQTSTATCQVSLLGRVSVVTRQQVNVITGVQTAEAVWTTASGDELYATSLGTAVPTGPSTIRFSGVTTIAGGTGRFLNAAGTAQVEGTVDTATGIGRFTYNGTLQFHGSDAAQP